MSQTPTFENNAVLAVTSHADVRCCRVRASTIANGIALVDETLSRQMLPPPQILNISYEHGDFEMLMTAPTEALDAQIAALAQCSAIDIDPKKFATVTVTCQGTYTTQLIQQLLSRLEQNQISPVKVFPGPLSVTFVVAADQRIVSVHQLHN